MFLEIIQEALFAIVIITRLSIPLLFKVLWVLLSHKTQKRCTNAANKMNDTQTISCSKPHWFGRVWKDITGKTCPKWLHFSHEAGKKVFVKRGWRLECYFWTEVRYSFYLKFLPEDFSSVIFYVPFPHFLHQQLYKIDKNLLWILGMGGRGSPHFCCSFIYSGLCNWELQAPITQACIIVVY